MNQKETQPGNGFNLQYPVLFFNLYSEMGGGEYVVYHIVRLLDHSYIKPIMMFPQEGSFADKARKLGVETVIFPFRPIMLQQLLNPINTWKLCITSFRLYRFLKERKIQILYCNDVLVLLLACIPSLLLRLPIVYNVIFIHEWYRTVVLNMIACLCVEKIICNSQRARASLLQASIFLSKKIEVLHPGVDTTIFRPRVLNEPNMLHEELSIPSEKKIIGMIAHFDPAKGHIIFLESAAELLRRRHDLRFIIIGSPIMSEVVLPYQHYYERVISKFKTMRLEHDVVFLQDRENIAELMRNIDVLVCPSEREAFGLVILEALVSGVPVVVSENVGALDLVSTELNVYTAPFNDTKAFADRIEQALLDSYNHPQLGEDVRQRYTEIFSWKAYTKKIETVFKQLLS